MRQPETTRKRAAKKVAAEPDRTLPQRPNSRPAQPRTAQLRVAQLRVGPAQPMSTESEASAPAPEIAPPAVIDPVADAG